MSSDEMELLKQFEETFSLWSEAATGADEAEPAASPDASSQVVSKPLISDYQTLILISARYRELRAR